jgi:hypothetical protein
MSIEDCSDIGSSVISVHHASLWQPMGLSSDGISQVHWMARPRYAQVQAGGQLDTDGIFQAEIRLATEIIATLCAKEVQQGEKIKSW